MRKLRGYFLLGSFSLALAICISFASFVFNRVHAGLLEEEQNEYVQRQVAKVLDDGLRSQPSIRMHGDKFEPASQERYNAWAIQQMNAWVNMQEVTQPHANRLMLDVGFMGELGHYLRSKQRAHFFSELANRAVDLSRGESTLDYPRGKPEISDVTRRENSDYVVRLDAETREIKMRLEINFDIISQHRALAGASSRVR